MYLHLRLDFQNPFEWYKWGRPNTQLNVQSMDNGALFGKINPGNNGETATAYRYYLLDAGRALLSPGERGD